jgi:hypothetical protein
VYGPDVGSGEASAWDVLNTEFRVQGCGLKFQASISTNYGALNPGRLNPKSETSNPKWNPEPETLNHSSEAET